jgi:hypothetical protein
MHNVAAVKYLRYAERHMRYPLAAVCSYELVALLTHKIPTVTALCAKQPWVAPLASAVLFWHLAATPKEEKSLCT